MLNYRKIRRWILAVLATAAVLVWLAVFQNIPAGFLKIIFFDAGQGDAIFIETADHKQILIDGGPDNAVLEKLGGEMDFFDREIDLVVLTHPDNDHLAGLIGVTDNFQINQILINGVKGESFFYQKWLDLIEEKGIPVATAKAGQIIDLGGGSRLKILWPAYSGIDAAIDEFTSSETNNFSVVAQLVYQEAEVLLTGDIENKAENYLAKQGGLESDVLKVAHHGSKASSGENFIQAVQPKISVISVGSDNRFGHPHSSVLEGLKKTLIFRTDIDGDIEMRTDGIGWRIKTSKPRAADLRP